MLSKNMYGKLMPIMPKTSLLSLFHAILAIFLLPSGTAH